MAANTSRPGSPPPAGLRDRARRAIQDEVGDIALRLFLEQGFDETTVDQVCVAAGLSPRSFFRYFPTKEDVVLETVATHGHQIAETLIGRPDGEAVWVALRKAFESQVELIAENEEWYLRFARLLMQTAAVRARQYEKSLIWKERLTHEIARRLGLSDAIAVDPRPAALATSAIGCLEAATFAWASADGAASVSDLLDLAMDAVSSPGPHDPALRA